MYSSNNDCFSPYPVVVDRLMVRDFKGRAVHWQLPMHPCYGLKDKIFELLRLLLRLPKGKHSKASAFIAQRTLLLVALPDLTKNVLWEK